jgi:ATP-binding cassette subfamily C protein PrsD
MKLNAPLVALVLLSMVSNVLMLTGPLFMLQVYDRVLASRSVPTLVALTGLIVVLFAFSALFDALRTRIAVRIGNAIDGNWSPRVFKAVLRARLVNSTNGPDPVRDLDTVRQFISNGGPLVVLDLPWLPLYLLFVFMLHPALGILCSVGAIVISGIAVVSELVLRKPGRAITVATVKRQQLDDDARANAETVRAMGMMNDVGALWRERNADLAKTQQVQADQATSFSSTAKAFRYFLQSAVLAVGAFLVIQGQVTGGIMIGASMISSRALAPIEMLVAQWRPMLAARDALTRLRMLLRSETDAAPEVTLPLPKNRLTVASMATGPSRQVGPLVQGISFELEKGDGLGILGHSGSGKSSLIRAILGIWPIIHGEVRLDGAAVWQYDPDLLGKAIGYLPQVVELFSGTIAQNIARFRTDATSQAIIDAAKAARVHDLILSFPQGYDTPVGELGSRLSAGQRQRIGLARALFGNPFMIVLDEPNSNLDSIGDEALTASMLVARERGAIVIVVAHRPSAIASVNKLLYLQNGRQTKFGLKAEVLREITVQPDSAGSRPSGQRQPTQLTVPAHAVDASQPPAADAVNAPDTAQGRRAAGG